MKFALPYGDKVITISPTHKGAFPAAGGFYEKYEVALTYNGRRQTFLFYAPHQKAIFHSVTSCAAQLMRLGRDADRSLGEMPHKSRKFEALVGVGLTPKHLMDAVERAYRGNTITAYPDGGALLPAQPLDRLCMDPQHDIELCAAFDTYLNLLHGDVWVVHLSVTAAHALRSVDRKAYDEELVSWLGSLSNEQWPDGGRWLCPICETAHKERQSAAECCAEEKTNETH